MQRPAKLRPRDKGPARQEQLLGGAAQVYIGWWRVKNASRRRQQEHMQCSLTKAQRLPVTDGSRLAPESRSYPVRCSSETRPEAGDRDELGKQKRVCFSCPVYLVRAMLLAETHQGRGPGFTWQFTIRYRSPFTAGRDGDCDKPDSSSARIRGKD